jgi:hypothetical protein
VRLTANGKSLTQPLDLRLDPRVNAKSLGVQTLVSLTKEMYEGARSAHKAGEDARALIAKLDASPDAANDALKAKLTALAPPPAAGGGRGGFGGGRGGGGRGGRGANAATAEQPTLDSVAAQMIAAAMAMQAAEVAPTAREVAACAEAKRQFTAIMTTWTVIKTQAAAVK